MQLTRYIKQLADSANIKVVTLNKNSSGLTSLLSEMPNVWYTHQLGDIPPEFILGYVTYNESAKQKILFVGGKDSIIHIKEEYYF